MVKSKRHKERKWTFPVPRDIFIQACNETGKHFDIAADSWGERERCYLRELCGEQYRLIESDAFGKLAITVRKGGFLEPLRNGKTKRPLQQPSGRYAAYLQSEHWRDFRLEVLEFWGYRCSICKSDKQLEVHHNTYDRVGRELLSDCIAVCRTCHKTIHHKLPSGNNNFEGTEPDDGYVLF